MGCSSNAPVWHPALGQLSVSPKRIDGLQPAACTPFARPTEKLSVSPKRIDGLQLANWDKVREVFETAFSIPKADRWAAAQRMWPSIWMNLDRAFSIPKADRWAAAKLSTRYPQTAAGPFSIPKADRWAAAAWWMC